MKYMAKKTNVLRLFVKSFSFSNDVGGTIMVPDFDSRYKKDAPETRYEVQVESCFHDYEVGWRYHGRLVDPKDIAMCKKLGTTGRERRPSQEENPVLRALLDAPFDPAKVYFSEHEIVKEGAWLKGETKEGKGRRGS